MKPRTNEGAVSMSGCGDHWEGCSFKMNGVLSVAGNWIGLEIVIRGEGSQPQNDEYVFFHLWFLYIKSCVHI